MPAAKAPTMALSLPPAPLTMPYPSTGKTTRIPMLAAPERNRRFEKCTIGAPKVRPALPSTMYIGFSNSGNSLLGLDFIVAPSA
jgi:hypothetical protein